MVLKATKIDKVDNILNGDFVSKKLLEVPGFEPTDQFFHVVQNRSLNTSNHRTFLMLMKLLVH